MFWYLTASPQLSPNAKSAFDEGVRGEALIYISVIALAELFYLNEKLGRPLDFAVELERLQNSSQYVLVPLLADDTLDLDQDRTITEMHDRMITGLARRTGTPLITRDVQITASKSV